MRDLEQIILSGSELSRRWVSVSVYNFMLSLGAEPCWAWSASKCQTIFGVWDEIRGAF